MYHYLAPYMGEDTTAKQAEAFAKHLQSKGYDVPEDELCFRNHGIFDDAQLSTSTDAFYCELDEWMRIIGMHKLC